MTFQRETNELFWPVVYPTGFGSGFVVISSRIQMDVENHTLDYLQELLGSRRNTA